MPSSSTSRQGRNSSGISLSRNSEGSRSKACSEASRSWSTISSSYAAPKCGCFKRLSNLESALKLIAEKQSKKSVAHRSWDSLKQHKLSLKPSICSLKLSNYRTKPSRIGELSPHSSGITPSRHNSSIPRSAQKNCRRNTPVPRCCLKHSHSSKSVNSKDSSRKISQTSRNFLKPASAKLEKALRSFFGMSLSVGNLSRETYWSKRNTTENGGLKLSKYDSDVTLASRSGVPNSALKNVPRLNFCTSGLENQNISENPKKKLMRKCNNTPKSRNLNRKTPTTFCVKRKIVKGRKYTRVNRDKKCVGSKQKHISTAHQKRTRSKCGGDRVKRRKITRNKGNTGILDWELQRAIEQLDKALRANLNLPRPTCKVSIAKRHKSCECQIVPDAKTLTKKFSTLRNSTSRNSQTSVRRLSKRSNSITGKRNFKKCHKPVKKKKFDSITQASGRRRKSIHRRISRTTQTNARFLDFRKSPPKNQKQSNLVTFRRSSGNLHKPVKNPETSNLQTSSLYRINSNSSSGTQKYIESIINSGTSLGRCQKFPHFLAYKKSSETPHKPQKKKSGTRILKSSSVPRINSCRANSEGRNIESISSIRWSISRMSISGTGNGNSQAHKRSSNTTCSVKSADIPCQTSCIRRQNSGRPRSNSTSHSKSAILTHISAQDHLVRSKSDVVTSSLIKETKSIDPSQKMFSLNRCRKPTRTLQFSKRGVCRSNTPYRDEPNEFCLGRQQEEVGGKCGCTRSEQCPCIGDEPPAKPCPRRPCLTFDEMGQELLKAAHQGRYCDVKVLLDQGVDVNYTHSSTWTALHRAAWAGHTAVVALLLKNGASPDCPTEMGFTPLHVASFNDSSGECARMLIELGADVNHKNKVGWTPLHYAVDEGNAAVISVLLQAGACASVRNNLGKKPYHLAKSCEIREMAMPGCSPSYRRYS